MGNSKRNLLDSIDRKIVMLLLKDARASFKTMAAEVGLTGPACAERVRRLTDEGVIRGFSAEVDWNRLGLPINALIRIGAAAEHGKGLLNAFKDTPNVIEVMRVTGADSYVVHARTASSEELEAVINKIGSYGTVTTSLVLSTPLQASERMSELLRSSE